MPEHISSSISVERGLCVKSSQKFQRRGHCEHVAQAEKPPTHPPMAGECCPPGSTPYLEATYTALGHVEKLDAVELYLSPVPASVTKGLLLFPDVCKLLALRRTGKTLNMFL